MNNEKIEEIDNFSKQSFENFSNQSFNEDKKSFEKELEFEKYIRELEEKIQDPNYDEEINFSLPENPTLEQSIKYSLCKKILGLQKSTGMSDEEISKKIGLDLKRTREILFSHIDKFNLNELVAYADKILSSHQELIYTAPRMNNNFYVKQFQTSSRI